MVLIILEKISVIIPIFNQERYLEKCLSSICAQTYSNLEILMIDDGSTDRTPDICRRFENNDSRFCYIKQANAGVAAARNKGLNCMSGNLIGFIDPDDWVEPNFYERLVSLYHQYDADIVSCGRYQVFSEREYVPPKINYKIFQCNTEKALELLVKNEEVKSHLWNRIYRPKVFANLRFEEGRVYEDVWILHQVFSKASKFVFTDEPLYYYRQHPDSIVRATTIDKQLDLCYAHQSRYCYLIHKYPQFQKDIIRNYGYEIAGLIDAAVLTSWKEYRLKKKVILEAIKGYCQLPETETSNPKIERAYKNLSAAVLYYKIKKYWKLVENK